jgi:glycosyltransferase involved in cell wall biosynthesis
MKILVVSEVFYPENFLINDLVIEWKKQGHTIEVLTQYPSYPESYIFDGYKNGNYSIEDWNGIKIHRYKLIEGYKNSIIKKFRNYILFVREGKKIAKRIGKDFDFVFVSQTGPLTVAYPALELKKKYNTSVAIWTCDIWPDVVYSYGIPKNFITDFILSKVIKGIYSECDNILVSSKRFEQTISRYVNKKIHYIPNWLQETENVESALRLDTSKINFTFTGNVSLYQNLLNVIKGFEKANINNSVLNIIGDGSGIDEIKNYVIENNISNVILHGRYPYNQMNDILNQSNILVISLISNEGIEKTEPLKLQSYLDSGKPIFGILNGSCKDIIEENKIGICSLPNDIDDISLGFKNIIKFSNEEGDNIKQSSKELMQSRFNKEKIISKINSVMGLR